MNFSLTVVLRSARGLSEQDRDDASLHVRDSGARSVRRHRRNDQERSQAHPERINQFITNHWANILIGEQKCSGMEPNRPHQRHANARSWIWMELRANASGGVWSQQHITKSNNSIVVNDTLDLFLV